MLQINFIRESTEKVLEGLKKRNFKSYDNLIGQALSVDKVRREKQKEHDEIVGESNKISKEVGNLIKSGQKGKADEMITKMSANKKIALELGQELAAAEEELQKILYLIPNVPSERVPAGKSPEDNINVRQHGGMPTLPPNAEPHWELIKKYDIIDFDLGNKVSGAGFPVYKGKGAKLQRALINFFLEEASKEGYTEIQPPIMVNKASGFGTGQLPDKEGQMYFVNEDELYLIPTAEVPITNLYRDVIMNEANLPIKNVAYTPCFRREAGSWGAHVRGLNRLHQFDKVEIVQIRKAEESYAVLEEMCNYVQGLLEKLELPYRKLLLCGGDMGFNSAMTYDLEVYSGGQQRWLEVSSVSNFETFQANRLKLRYKNKEGKTQLLHTLNGSALALPRIVAAILENNQTPDCIRIPKVLVPYTKFDMIGAGI